jgi:hypothetical protein
MTQSEHEALYASMNTDLNCSDPDGTTLVTEDELRQLLAVCRELEADAERLDWLETELDALRVGEHYLAWGTSDADRRYGASPSLRAAIDSVRKQ